MAILIDGVTMSNIIYREPGNVTSVLGSEEDGAVMKSIWKFCRGLGTDVTVVVRRGRQQKDFLVLVIKCCAREKVVGKKRE